MTMAVHRTAWAILWVLNSALTTRGQVTTCTAANQEPCYLARADVSAGCGSATDVGVCFTYAGIIRAWIKVLTRPGRFVMRTRIIFVTAVSAAPFRGLTFAVRRLCHLRQQDLPPPACGDGTNLCDDPHMQGLSGQTIDWSGVDGAWYSLIQDVDLDLNVNIRLTAPLPKEFPNRQLITGLSVISDGHSLAIKVSDPYDMNTNGCPMGVSPCLANGGLLADVDGAEVDDLLLSSRNEYVADGIAVSASNLPVECRQFGGDKVWARMYGEMLQGKRDLEVVNEKSFKDWVLRFGDMAALDWCTRYLAEHDLADVQSIHAIFKIVTSSVTVRLNVGPNHQGDGELDWDGRVLPNLEFWQMDVGVQGLSIESESLSGILGETARPVYDGDGRAVMEGYDAFRGTVEDYRVSGPLGTHFSFLDETEL